MIESFGDAATEDFFHGLTSPRARRLLPASLVKRGLRKLDILHAATRLGDLAGVPGNNLEQLIGNWKGFHSIRINDQYRVCFRWKDGNAHEVQIVDYH